jgi:hypothetical protein
MHLDAVGGTQARPERLAVWLPRKTRDYQGFSNAPDRIRTCDLRFRSFSVSLD